MPNFVTLQCPSCGAGIKITPQTRSAKCEYCGVEHILKVNLPAAAPGGETPAGSRPRAQAPLPDGVTLKRYTNGLRFVRRWFSISYFFLAFFCLFWDGFLCFWYSMAFKSQNLVFALFPMLHLAVGVYLTYSVIAGFVNSSVIELNRKKLVITHGPLPWPGEVDVPIGEMEQLYVTEKVGRKGSRSYKLCALLKNGRKIDLLSNLDSPEIAFFIEQQVEEWLKISDRPVAGEIARASY